jgi:6-pyruvoyltetrahydropterin/6-carboxytetrahydropterin synthase
MYEITVEAEFSSAHSLRGYEGGCESLHGHNWRVEVFVRSARLDTLGMVVDFRTLKARVRALVKDLDHKNLNEIPPFDDINPTAENISEHIYKAISAELEKDSVRVSMVRVWESNTASAAYYENSP